MSVNGRHYPRAERGLEDDGATVATGKPCAVRRSDGSYCYLADGHVGAHEGVPLRYDHPQQRVDHRVMAKPRASKPPVQAVAVEVTWPALGSTYRDDSGRILVIVGVSPKSRTERHIWGTINGETYACSRMVFDALWHAIV